jgi:acyl-CoA thioesterase
VTLRESGQGAAQQRSAPGRATHHFDADTALEPLAPGRWRAHVPAHWVVGRGPNGGFLAAVAARAAEAAAGRPLRSLTLHFLAAPRLGPIEVAAALEREGRRYTAASLRILQDGKPVTLALATLGELPDEGIRWDAAGMPAARPVAESERIALERAGLPEFARNYDMRWALDGGPASGDKPPETGGWLRAAEPRALDAPLVAAMTDAWLPVAFVVLGRVVAAPTLDLTIHIRASLPPAGMRPDDHVLGRFSSRLSVGGVWEEDGELWTPGGELVAQSRQLALARDLRA